MSPGAEPHRVAPDGELELRAKPGRAFCATDLLKREALQIDALTCQMNAR